MRWVYDQIFDPTPRSGNDCPRNKNKKKKKKKSAKEILFRHFLPCFSWRTVLTRGERWRTQRARRCSPQTRSAWEVTGSSDRAAFYCHRAPAGCCFYAQTRTRRCTSSTGAQLNLKPRMSEWRSFMISWTGPCVFLFFFFVFFFFFSLIPQMVADGPRAELECLSVAHRIRAGWANTFQRGRLQVRDSDSCCFRWDDRALAKWGTLFSFRIFLK